MPEDSDVESALASLYTETGNYDKARAQSPNCLPSIRRTSKPSGAWASSKSSAAIRKLLSNR